MGRATDMTDITTLSKLPLLLLASGLVACTGASRERTNTGTNNNNSSSTQDAGALDGLTEYGRGEHAIYLSTPNPRRYCWYIEETVLICGGNGGTRDDYFTDVCYDDETDCAARQPVDTEVDNGTCWRRVTYDNIGNRSLYGDCDRVDAFQRGDEGTQCMFHRHCPDNMLCTDYQCICPPGVVCGCFECPPGATCNPSLGVCEGGSGAVDAGTFDGGGSSGTPDAGCMCPPVAAPRCEGDLRVETMCDTETCEVFDLATDCGASGLVCDPSTVECVEDVECRTVADCPPPPAAPPGQCAEVRCERNECVAEVGPC